LKGRRLAAPFEALAPALVVMALVTGFYVRRLIVMPGRLIRGDE